LKHIKADEAIRLLRACHDQAETTATSAAIYSYMASQTVYNPTSSITSRTRILPLKAIMGHGPA